MQERCRHSFCYKTCANTTIVITLHNIPTVILITKPMKYLYLSFTKDKHSSERTTLFADNVSNVFHTVSLFFSLLCCMVCYGTNKDRNKVSFSAISVLVQ